MRVRENLNFEKNFTLKYELFAQRITNQSDGSFGLQTKRTVPLVCGL